jgi:hypothetical protein
MSKHSIPFFLLVAAAVPAISAEKIVLIGDSLSDDGGFGAGLAQSLSKRGTACSFTASNSRFESWTEGDFSCCKVGSHTRVYANGVASKPAETRASPPATWSLGAFLDPVGGLCAPQGQSVDRLVVQLGTNPSKDYEKYVKKIVQLACRHQVKNVNFVLPPEDRARTQSRTNQKMADVIAEYRPCETTSTSYFPSSYKVEIASKDFRKDGTHFWSSPSEKNWLKAVEAWSDSGFPTLPIPAAINKTTKGHGNP